MSFGLNNMGSLTPDQGASLEELLLSFATLPELRRFLNVAFIKQVTPTWTPAPLPQQFLDFIANNNKTTIGLYSPLTNLGEPSALPAELLELEKLKKIRTAFPQIVGQELIFRECAFSDLAGNSAGDLAGDATIAPRSKIKEPPKHFIEVVPQILFIPALLADKSGHRIGRGRGYYDRYLAAHPEIQMSVVLLHDLFLLEKLNSEWIQSHDQPISAALTNSIFIDFRSVQP
jgi:5,10-methenyltetrahydrofolate synthetase